MVIMARAVKPRLIIIRKYKAKVNTLLKKVLPMPNPITFPKQAVRAMIIIIGNIRTILCEISGETR